MFYCTVNMHDMGNRNIVKNAAKCQGIPWCCVVVLSKCLMLQAELRRAQAAASELMKEAQVKKQMAERKLKSVSAHFLTF